MVEIDRGRAVAALTAEFAAIDDLLASLSAADWKTPTALPGWDVQANVAHIIGTEAMLLGEPNPTIDVDAVSLPHVRNDIGAFNEIWVIALASATPEEMLAAYRERVTARLDAVAALTPEEWSAESFTPAGPDTYGRFMRIRAMDCWMHEQDIRDAVGRPGHEDGPVVDFVLDEMLSALGYVVGKRAGAPDGTSVTFDLQGPAGRAVHVAVEGRAAVVDSLPGPATTVVRLPVGRFTRLAGGRSFDLDGISYEGDEALGERVVTNLAFMI
jgi:uncharacterized protein (TIGR03083 family)